MQKKYDALDGLRAFSCLGIVLMHVFVNGKYGSLGFPHGHIIVSFTQLVFLFMTISGFGMCCGYYDKVLNNKINIVDFYRKRYLKILPYFAFLCLLDFAISPSIHSLCEVFANLTLCFGLIPNANITVIGVGWFLGTVFAFYMLFPFFCALLSNKYIAWFSTICAFIMNCLCIGYFGVDRKSIAYSFVYFMIGGLIYLYSDAINEFSIIRWGALIITVGAIAFYYLFYQGTIVLLVICASILIYAMKIDGPHLLNNRVVKFIGGISFEIYLCHMVVYRVVEKLGILHTTGNYYIDYIFVSLIVFIGAIAFAIITKILIEKVMELYKGKGRK